MRFFKNNLIRVSVLSMAIFMSASASASLLIEPHVGYNVYGNGDTTTATISYNGAQYGGRLGMQYFGLMGGLDYTKSSFTYKTLSSGVSTNYDEKRDQLGVFVGYNLPILLRAWVGYNFSDKVTDKSDGSWESGNGMEFGIGFTGLPFLSINMEYRTSTYNKADTGVISPKNETKEVVLSISAPFTIL
jgi:hypothetical protein